MQEAYTSKRLASGKQSCVKKGATRVETNLVATSVSMQHVGSKRARSVCKDKLA